jgi:hypothetical protein
MYIGVALTVREPTFVDVAAAPRSATLAVTNSRSNGPSI